MSKHIVAYSDVYLHLDRFRSCIKHLSLQQKVFGKVWNENFFAKSRWSDKTWLIECMGYLLTIGGIYLYSKFRHWTTQSGADSEHPQYPNSLFLKRLLDGKHDIASNVNNPEATLRLLRILDGVYDCYEMNISVIRYLILNAQIESGFNLGKGLCKLLGFPKENSFELSCDYEKQGQKKVFNIEGQNLIEAFNFVIRLRNDPNKNVTLSQNKIYVLHDIQRALRDVVESMTFLTNIEIHLDEMGNVIFKEHELELNTHGVIKAFVVDEKEQNTYVQCENKIPTLCLLEKIFYIHRNEHISTPNIELTYQSFNEEYSFKKIYPSDIEIANNTSAADYYKKICGYLPGTNLISSFVQGMLTNNMLYHNIIAPAIVDVIEYDEKKKILESLVITKQDFYQDSFDNIFKNYAKELNNACKGKGGKEKIWKTKIKELAKNYTEKSCFDWDTLVTRVIMYESPTKVLETILLPLARKSGKSHSPSDTSYSEHVRNKIVEMGDNIIAGLELRYGCVFGASKVSDKQHDKFTKMQNRIAHLQKLFPSHDKQMECQILAHSYISSIVSKLTDPKNDSATTINKFATSCISNSLDILDKSCEEEQNSKIDTKETNAFLYTILVLISFYEGIFNSCDKRIEYEYERNIGIVPQEKIEQFQKEILDNFLIGVGEKTMDWAKKINQTVPIDQALQQALKELHKFAINTDRAKHYRVVLARDHINAETLKKIYDIKNDSEIVFFTHDGEIDFEYALNSGELRCQLHKILGVLVGKDNVCNKKNTKQSNLDIVEYKTDLKRVIYPQIATFAKHQEDGDSNKCLTLDRNGAFTDWHRKGEVQIWTEFKYDIKTAYYTLPNINRVAAEWWIEPLLIPCFEFDETLNKYLKSWK